MKRQVVGRFYDLLTGNIVTSSQLTPFGIRERNSNYNSYSYEMGDNVCIVKATDLKFLELVEIKENNDD